LIYDVTLFSTGSTSTNSGSTSSNSTNNSYSFSLNNFAKINDTNVTAFTLSYDSTELNSNLVLTSDDESEGYWTKEKTIIVVCVVGGVLLLAIGGITTAVILKKRRTKMTVTAEGNTSKKIEDNVKDSETPRGPLDSAKFPPG
jgi:hypothetical protein